jgi:hypothetical protein
MPFEVALIIAGVILLVAVITLIAVIAARRQAAKEEEMKRAASARGWQFESKTERGYRVHRWSGSTDGIAWTAESLRQISGSSKNQQQRRNIARCQVAWHPGISGAIVCMGVAKGKEATGPGIAQGDGLFARVAQKAAGFAFDKAIDVYFGDAAGKEVDAATMHRVDATRIPGFIVMAANKDEGGRILMQGFEKALVEASADQASVLANDRRPWILLRPNALSLARMERFRDINEIEGFVRAGIGLTRQFRFGHQA